MPPEFFFGRVKSAAATIDRTSLTPETPFILLVAGNFRGRRSSAASPELSAINVDSDNFERVFARRDVQLQVSVGNGQIVDLPIRSMDDFHPDSLLRRVPWLATLVEKRANLANSATASAASAEIQQLLDVSTASESEPAEPPTATESGDDTLKRLLGGELPHVASSPHPNPISSVEHILRAAVAPSLVPATTVEQAALLSALDLELAQRLRTLLHAPEFQSLESAWHGLDLLVRNFGGDENIKIRLLDVSKPALAADLASAEDLESSNLAQLLAQMADDQLPAICLGQYRFGDDLADIELLGRLAKVFALHGVPFLAGADPRLLGCASVAQLPDPATWSPALPETTNAAWSALRELPESAFLSLALPQILLRQPYGKDSDLVETFPFEELPAGLPDEGYLWGNPSILGGYLLAEAFRHEPWEIPSPGVGELDGLPIHRFTRDGETEVKPCAEVWLSERAAEAIRNRGGSPILSVKGRDAVRMTGLRSLHKSGGPLAAWWRS